MSSSDKTKLFADEKPEDQSCTQINQENVNSSAEPIYSELKLEENVQIALLKVEPELTMVESLTTPELRKASHFSLLRELPGRVVAKLQPGKTEKQPIVAWSADETEPKRPISVISLQVDEELIGGELLDFGHNDLTSENLTDHPSTPEEICPLNPPPRASYISVLDPKPASTTISVPPTCGVLGLQAGGEPLYIECPNCHRVIKSKTVRRSGSYAWWVFFVCLLLGFLFCCIPWLCSCCPFCNRSYKDVEHYCPKCNVCIGRYKRQQWFCC